jgi:hypothetical protein
MHSNERVDLKRISRHSFRSPGIEYYGDINAQQVKLDLLSGFGPFEKTAGIGTVQA